MIQGAADIYRYGIKTLQWLGIWLLVTFLIVGAIGSVSWARLAYEKYEWTFKIMHSIDE